MKVDDVVNCSFVNWFPYFKDVTFKSEILLLDEDFVSYILKDGIVLPKSCESQLQEKSSCQANDSDDSDPEDNWKDADNEEAEAPTFSDLDSEIRKSIRSLGGKVFPKLNWSSPRDASWIAFNNSCCCMSVSDVYLLLKSSDFVLHDLTKPYDLCEDFASQAGALPSSPFCLVLREWVEIEPSGEFRCFVQNNALIGICQREHSSYFDHIHAEKNDIVQDIVFFFLKKIQPKFPCSHYVFDVYRKKKGSVWLVDFNPFGKVTDALLFDWRELLNGSVRTDSAGLPEFRFVSSNRGVQPRLLSYHAIPRDIVDISTGDSLKLVDLIRLKIDEQNCNHSAEDETNQENGIH